MQKTNSDFNLKTINTKEYAEILSSTIQYGGNCFVVGRRGSGKTAIIDQVIEAGGCKKFFWNVSTLERVDTAGFPDLMSLNRKEDYVRYILPVIFKPLLEGNDPVVAILDEIDKADKDLYAPLLEFLQFRSINGRKFNNLKSVLMTGNLPSEGGKRPILPLLDRTEKYLLEPNTKHWIDWGSTIGKIHPSVLAYITDNPSDLYGEVNPGENYGGTSPRMWEEVSKIAKFGDANNWSANLISTKASGCIGKVSGIKYRAYFDHYQVLIPYIKEILEGEKVKNFLHNEDPSKKITAVMLLCTRVANMLDDMVEKNEKKIPIQIINAGKFLSKIDTEIALVGLRNGIGAQRMLKLMSVKEYDHLLDRVIEQLQLEKA